MEPMDLDDDSFGHTPTLRPSKKQTPSHAYIPGNLSMSAFSPLASPSTGYPAFLQNSGVVSSSPAYGYPQPAMASPYKRGNPVLFRSATFDVSRDNSFLTSSPAQSFSRGATPGLESWRGSGTLGAEGASCASMETSDRSDVSEMEVVGNSPSPHWDRVRSALGSFSIFSGRPEIQQEELTAYTPSKEECVDDSGMSKKPASSIASWEPTLSSVQAAGTFRRGNKKARSSSSKPAATETLSSTPTKKSAGCPSEVNRASTAMRPLTSTPTVKSKSGGCGMCLKAFSCLFVVVAVMCAVLLQRHVSVNKNFADMDAELLKNEMASKVFGQHIAMDVVPSSIDAYLSTLRDANDGCQDDSCSVPPLVLSFHGWTGVGKNFVTDVITSLFSAKTVTKFLIPFHFPHQELDPLYRSQIKSWILTNVTRYSVNFFIFDEMDKAHPGVIEGIQSSLSKMRERNSFRSPSIFIFLSNSFGTVINHAVFHAMVDGRDRESLSVGDFSNVFHGDKAGDHWYRQLQWAITVPVPFLPLEKHHIVQCIRRDLVTKKLSTHTDLVNRILQELMFTTLATGHAFSQTGCKRVSDKVNLVAFD